MSANRPLPGLPYTLRTRKRSIAIFWSIQVLVSSILIITIYFALKYGAKTEDKITLAVPTAILGITTLLGLTLRIRSLISSTSTCRPLGCSSRFALDFFTWSYLLSASAITVIISLSCAFGLIRLASLPQSILLYFVGTQLLVATLAKWAGVERVPISMSSTRKGEALVPGVFVVVEDVVAVEGSGGTGFRRAWKRRVEASEVLRGCLWGLNLFWGAGSLATAVGVTLIVFLVEDRDVGFAVGWSVPWVWAGIGTVWTVASVKRALKEEERVYGGKEVAQGLMGEGHL